MPTFQAFNIEQVLGEYPTALARYRGNFLPFQLTCLGQSFVKELNALVAEYDNHDRIRLELDYQQQPDKAETLSWLVTSRAFCCELATDEAWDALKKYQDNATREAINTLKPLLQDKIKFAYYTIDDFTKAFSLLNAIERYAKSANLALRKQQQKLPPFLVHDCQQCFQTLIENVLKERKKLSEMALHILAEMNEKGDFTQGNCYVQHVLPLLKQYEKVPEDWDGKLPYTVTQEAFAQLIGGLQVNAEPELMTKLLNLRLFEKEVTTPFEITSFNYQQKLVFAPRQLAGYLIEYAKRPWYEKFLDYGVDKLLRVFNSQLSFELYTLNRWLNDLEFEMAFLPSQDANAELVLANKIEKIESILARQMQQILGYRPTGFWAWFQTTLEKVVLEWAKTLWTQHSKLQTYRVQIAAHLAEQTEERQTNEQPLWPPETLKQINHHFQKTASQLSSIKADNVQHQFAVAKQKYTLASDYIGHFLMRIRRKEVFLATQLTIVDRVAGLRINEAEVDAAIAQFSAHLTLEQQQAMTLLKQLLIGFAYPDLETFDRALDSLMQNNPNKRDAKDASMLDLIHFYILPRESCYHPQAFAFVQAYNKALAQQWRDGFPLNAEEALIFFKQLLTDPNNATCGCPEGQEIAISPLSDALLINGYRIYPILPQVTSYIQTLRWFPDNHQVYQNELNKLVRQYLAGYTGRNATYETLIICIVAFTEEAALLCEYYYKRFDHLLAHHGYSSLLEERFINAVKQQPALQALIHQRLEQYLANNQTWTMLVAEVLTTFGTQEQYSRYRQQLDKMRMQSLEKLLKESATVEAVQAFCQRILTSTETAFPGAEEENFAALFNEKHYTGWALAYHTLIETFGDNKLRAYNANLWLQKLLQEPHAIQPHETIFLEMLETIAQLYTTDEAFANHCFSQCDHFLTHYQRQNSLALMWLKRLLETDVIKQSKSHVLGDKLKRCEAMHYSREKAEQTAADILQHLKGFHYKEAASKLNYLIENQHYDQPINGNSPLQPIGDALKLTIEQVEMFLQELIFENLPETASFYTYFLQEVKGEMPTLTYLCQESAHIRSAYERLLVDLAIISHWGDLHALQVDATLPHLLQKGLSTVKKHYVSEAIQSAMANVPSTQPVYPVLAALQRLLLDVSADRAADEHIIAHYASAKSQGEAHGGSEDSLATHALQSTFDETLLAQLESLKKGLPLALTTCDNFANHYVLCKLTDPTVKYRFVEAIDNYYPQALQAVIEALQVTNPLLSKVDDGTLTQVRVLIQKFYFVSAFDTDKPKLQSAIDKLFSTYVTYWTNPTDTQPLAWLAFETIIENCGNTIQRQHIAKMASLRQANDHADLTHYCQTLVAQDVMLPPANQALPNVQSTTFPGQTTPLPFFVAENKAEKDLLQTLPKEEVPTHFVNPTL